MKKSVKTMKTSSAGGAITCGKCGREMREVILPTYEYVEGIPLHNIPAFKCPRCGQIYFTEEQANRLEELTNEAKQKTFVIKRRISYAGRSLVINIPEDLVAYMNLVKGKIASLIPIDKKRFLVEVS